MEAAGWAYAAGVTDAWRLMTSSDQAERLAVIAVAHQALKARLEIAKQTGMR